MEGANKAKKHSKKAATEILVSICKTENSLFFFIPGYYWQGLDQSDEELRFKLSQMYGSLSKPKTTELKNKLYK